jgi:hypothetical protein
MDEKTLGIIIMGLIVVALGAFGSWMEGRSKKRESDNRQHHLI